MEPDVDMLDAEPAEDDAIYGESVGITHDETGAVVLTIYHGCCKKHCTVIRLSPEMAEAIANDMDFEAGIGHALLSGLGVPDWGHS